MATFRVDVDGKKVGRQIQGKIEDGVDSAADEINDDMRRVAKQKIRNEKAVFTRELLNGFTNSKVTFGDSTVASLSNLSQHAPYQEHGVSGTKVSRDTPYKYMDKKPPLAALIPWVVKNLHGSFWPDSLGTNPNGDGGAGGKDSLDPAVRLLAFWLQEKIYEEGIEGVQYMESAQLWADKNAADVTARAVSKEIKRL